MGLADWSDDKLNKKISKQTSRRALGNEIRQWIKEIYFNNRPVELLTVKLIVDKDNSGYGGVVSYAGNFVIKGRRCGDVNYEICDKYNCAEKDFVDIVKYVHNEKVLPSLETVYGKEYDKCVFILSDIPIHFGKQKDYYGDYDDGQYLGLYCRTYQDNKREIILFEDAIKAEAKGVDDYLENLIWKVIIHEYAHAIMDAIFHDDNKLRKHDHKLYKYREESLANAFALKVLGMSMNTLITKSGFSKIEDFVKSQPEEYRYGHDLYNKCGDLLKMMEFWREMKIEGNKRF